MNMNPRQTLSRFLNAPPTARVVAGALAMAAGASPVSAHPGHSFQDVSPSHWVTSPDHASALLGTGIALWLVTRAVQNVRCRRWAEVMAVALVCGAGMQWGIGR
jgi:hypothetical protein